MNTSIRSLLNKRFLLLVATALLIAVTGFAIPATVDTAEAAGWSPGVDLYTLEDGTKVYVAFIFRSGPPYMKVFVGVYSDRDKAWSAAKAAAEKANSGGFADPCWQNPQDCNF